MATDSTWTGSSRCSCRRGLVGTYAQIQSRLELLASQPLTMCVALDTRAPRTLAQAGSPQGEDWRVGGPSEELRTKRRRDGARIVEVLLCKSYRERKLRRNKLVLRRKGEVKEARMEAAKRTMGVDLIETKKAAWRTQPPPGRITDGLGAAIRWVGDSFNRSVPRDAVRWGTFNAQGTGGKGLGSTESLDGHWGPLDKLLNEFYGVHGHVLVITDPGVGSTTPLN